MSIELRGRYLRPVPSGDGPQADVALIESNGDELVVRCLVKSSGTEIGGDREGMEYLHNKYGEENVCQTARLTVLSNTQLP